MATPAPATASPQPQIPAAPVLPTTPVPSPPVAGTTSLQVQLIPSPKLQFWEGPGFAPAIAALFAVGITFWGLQRSTRKQIDATALRTREQLDHAFDQARADREHSGAQAKKERAHAGRQATLDRLLEARQALYTLLIDDYVDVLRMFGEMISPEFENTPQAAMPLMKMAGSVNKTWLLSDVPTSHAVRDLYSRLNEMHFRLLKLLPSVQRARAKLAVATEKRRELIESRHAKATLLQDLPEKSNSSYRNSPGFERLMARLPEEIKSIDVQSKALLDEAHILMIDKAYAEATFMKTLTDEQNSMMKEINHVMATARAELGLSGDIGILKEQSNVMAARVKAALAELAKGPTASVA